MSKTPVKSDMDRILKSPNKCINDVQGVGGIIARLWRIMLLDLNINGSQFEVLLNDFIINAKRTIADNRVAKLFTRGNLRRELERPEMTFKVFIKGLKVLKMKHLKLAVELTSNSGKTYIFQTAVDLSSLDINEQEDADDKSVINE